VPEQLTPQTLSAVLRHSETLIRVTQGGAGREIRAASDAGRSGWHHARRDQHPVSAQGGKLPALFVNPTREVLVRDRVIVVIGKAPIPRHVEVAGQFCPA
jgi:hypothetical protein